MCHRCAQNRKSAKLWMGWIGLPKATEQGLVYALLQPIHLIAGSLGHDIQYPLSRLLALYDRPGMPPMQFLQALQWSSLQQETLGQ